MTTPQAVHTDKAPKAIGPYSQAIVAGGTVHCSGQVGMDPTTGELVSEDVEAQTEQCLRNLQAVLEAAGSSFAQAVRCTVYLTDLGDFARVNQVYARAFEGLTPPSRACVEVSALPKGALVEIDCLASLA
ncbi:MAG TPA: RidA family protein [Planctomycetes bacterium]|nr:RidA family protein [Planctomycetota bacterium]HIL36264.1 RidA family protein [Planctomycetota bacterium]